MLFSFGVVRYVLAMTNPIEKQMKEAGQTLCLNIGTAIGSCAVMAATSCLRAYNQSVGNVSISLLPKFMSPYEDLLVYGTLTISTLVAAGGALLATRELRRSRHLAKLGQTFG
ncbi:MAG: hypothetical protein WAO98_10235 [Alphaproteobacteria bacterium]